MFSVGKRGESEAGVKPQQTLTIPEWICIVLDDK